MANRNRLLQVTRIIIIIIIAKYMNTWNEMSYYEKAPPKPPKCIFSH
jgi:hypothetical protein